MMRNARSLPLWPSPARSCYRRERSRIALRQAQDQPNTSGSRQPLDEDASWRVMMGSQTQMKVGETHARTVEDVVDLGGLYRYHRPARPPDTPRRDFRAPKAAVQGSDRRMGPRGFAQRVLRDVLFSRDAMARGYFEREKGRRLIGAHASGRLNLQKQLWILFQRDLTRKDTDDYPRQV